jgi:hypothetical protein
VDYTSGSRSNRGNPKSIVEFFRQPPLVGIKLDLERDQDTGRDVEL